MSAGSASLRRVALEDERWLAHVAARPDATPFHHPDWAAVVRDTYGFPVFALAFVTEAGEIAGGLPVAEVRDPLRRRRWVSLPFTDHCPPLLPDGLERRDLEDLLDDARREAGLRSFELRDEIAAGAEHARPAGVRHVLALDRQGAGALASVKPSVRRNVRAATRNGIRIVRADERRDVAETFYRLQGITRRRLGVPVQPRRYFESLWRNVVATKLGFLLLALVDDRPIAGAIFLEWNGTTVYKHGASDHAFWSLRPNDLLFWTAIESSLEQGRRAFDFGKSAFEDEGLRRYKSGWGASELPLAYTTLSDERAQVSASRVAGIAAPVIRHAPVWFARWLGTAFYRYAA